MKKPIIVTGISTEVGKTIASAILVKMLNRDYWKPIQCGPVKDTTVIETLVPTCHIHPPFHSFEEPVSPHQAAHVHNLQIDINAILLPKSARGLIIETAGGVLVPLNSDALNIDLFSQWDAQWIVVSKNYLGSINHTLLTLDLLKRRNADILGLIFNGIPNPHTENAILNFSRVPMFGRMLSEQHINEDIINKYATLWQKR